MSDPRVAKWKHRGTVYLWRYRDNWRNYPGWNLSADSAGCESLIGLLDLMLASRYSSQITIPTSPPTIKLLQSVSDPQRWSSKPELALAYPKSKVEAGHWNLKTNTDRVAITMGELRLKELRSGVIDVSKGRGDWAAPNDDDAIDDAQFLYFWPLVWARRPRTRSRTA